MAAAAAIALLPCCRRALDRPPVWPAVLSGTCDPITLPREILRAAAATAAVQVASQDLCGFGDMLWLACLKVPLSLIITCSVLHQLSPPGTRSGLVSGHWELSWSKKEILPCWDLMAYYLAAMPQKCQGWIYSAAVASLVGILPYCLMFVCRGTSFVSKSQI